MYWVLGCIIACLLAVILIQQNASKRRGREIRYITQKIKSIMQEQSLERVQVVTADEPIRELNEAINELLEYNHRNLVGYIRTKTSMKKMLSNVSHDLKTPLTVVLGYLEMIQIKEQDTEEIHRVYQKVQKVIQLINQFFDLAKLESGDKQIELSTINLSECVRKCIINFASILEKSGIEVEITIPEQEVFMIGNEEALTRVISNLISNALKYGEDGRYLGVIVKEEVREVIIQVIDHGMGIEKQHQEDVFERLYRLEDSRSERYGGSGLGLAITKTLVEAMNGQITLQSIPYEETIFQVKVPKAKRVSKENVRNE